MSNMQDISNEIKLKITELSDTIKNESWVNESNSAAKNQLMVLNGFSNKFSSNACVQVNIKAQPLSHAHSPYSMYPSSAQDSSIETNDLKKGYEKR